MFAVNLRDVVFWNGVAGLGGPVLEANREVEVCECHMTRLLDEDCNSCQWRFSRSKSQQECWILMGFSAAAVVLDDEVWELATEMAESTRQKKVPHKRKIKISTLCVLRTAMGGTKKSFSFELQREKDLVLMHAERSRSSEKEKE
ncbi:hypothetical protein ACFX2A_000916 [Malus domestica]